MAATCIGGGASALPTIEKGAIKRQASEVRVAVAGTLREAEWGSPVHVRVGAGNRMESLDVATFATPKPGRLVYQGAGLVRQLRIDLTRSTFRATLAGIGPVVYQQPFWVTFDPGTAYEFALPIVEGKARTRVGGKVVHPLDGLAFSPWEDGQDPTQGATTDAKQIDRRLRRIARHTRGVRTYGSTHGLELIPERARARGLEVSAGAWIGTDAGANQTEIAGLVAAARAGLVDLAIVGTEALLRGDVDEVELLAYLQQVRAALDGTGVPVTTAETWDVLLAHPAVVEACDVVAANVYPYWEGIALDAAIGVFDDHYADLVTVAEGKEVLIAETGWPSAGDAVGAAEPSPEHAAFYFASVRTWARAEHVRVLYFAAFDEAWKVANEGPQGAHWGIADSKGKLKPGMRAALAGRTIAKTWISGPIGGPPS